MEHCWSFILDLVVSLVYAPKVMELAFDDYTVRDLLCGQIRVKHFYHCGGLKLHKRM